METRKRLNIGCSDFKNLMDNDNYFIDKSLFIEEVINAEKSVLLIPRPRRFGKTLNLSMLRYFFDVNIPQNEKLFSHLKIWQTDNNIKEKCGKYPVIYLSLKDAKKDNWNDTLQHIKNEIVVLYRNHRYLLDSNVIDDSEKEVFNKIIYNNADTSLFENSIKNLSIYLQRYHNQHVVILIDEYDTPIQAGYKNFYKEVISFMRNFLSGAFKDNPYLYKGVITGILRVS